MRHSLPTLLVEAERDPVIAALHADFVRERREPIVERLQRAAEPTDAELADLFAELFADPDVLLALYPAGDFDSNLARYMARRTDVRFACPTLAFAEARTAGDTCVYHFTWVSPDDPFGLGVPHGAELVPLFGDPEGIAGLEPGLQGEDAAMSADMEGAWAAFAAAGEPSGSDDSVWRLYGDDGQVGLLDQPLELVTEIRDGRCEAVEELTELRR